MAHLVDLLRHAAAERADHGVTCEPGGRLAFPELLEAARRVAGGAVADGVRPGDPVALLVMDAFDFLPALWGVWWAGAVPVPLAAPRDASAEEAGRVRRVLALLGEPAVVVDRSAPGGRDVGDWLSADPLEAPVPSDAPALVQFSSGSTRDPQGVVLTHANLLANLAQLEDRFGIGPEDVAHSWMPHFHDMGLIGGHLIPLRAGAEHVRMSPLDAMRDPLRWLASAASHRATWLGATNFALDRANRALAGARHPRPDLSAVRRIVLGAEPLSAAVCREFSRLAGVPESVHLPAYGLAEACVGVSVPWSGGVRTTPLDGRDHVLLGPPLEGMQVRIVDEGGTPRPDGAVGHVQIRGPNVTAGYWRAPEATAAARDGEWTRTGDLGALVDGEIAITGRHKDVVCVGGRNLHAHDVEGVAEAVGGVASGGALVVPDRRGEVEGLAVLVRPARGASTASVLHAVRDRVAGAVGVDPTEVIPLDDVPRTTSGKKRRAACAAALHEGAYDDAVGGDTVDGVRAVWEQVLGRSLAGEEDVRFRDLGGSSVAAMDLLGRIEARFGVPPDHRLLLQGATVAAMARLVERRWPTPALRLARPVSEPIAIVGAACRLPGADTPEALWEAVRRGDTFIGPAPEERWGTPTPYTGGFLQDVATFDPEPFGLSAEEAAAMDPQQRLVLVLARECLERAGDPRTREIGVFVGAGQQSYLETVLDHLDDGLPPGTMAGNLLNMIAARVAHHLDLRGPALTVDTACSASLVALHLACQSLRSGECEAALVGGVNLNLTPTAHRLFDLAGALSPTGRCRPFAEDADGMVPGEGGIVILVRPLSAALADGAPILGVVRGTAINNDGASLGVMAPNPAGQERVIHAALSAAGVDAASVDVVQAHGTGTPVGDAVERSVLGRVYPHGPRRGAVKGTVGHLLGAAGLAGLLDLLGALEHGQRGAVSSFGFGGTNAHAIVDAPPEGAPAPRRATPSSGRRLWLGEADATGWVHTVSADPGGGLAWRPCPRGPNPLRRGGRYLVTGASGALGTHLARWLWQRHRAALVLTSRRDPPVRAWLEARGAEVTWLRADLPAEVPDLSGVLPLDGGFHLAGTTGPDALRVKRDGLLALRDVPVGFWVLFSSISAVLPGLDQGLEDYAAANRWLDAHARERHAAGARVTSIAWSPWVGPGMAAGRAEALRERGLEPVPPATALAALEWALGSGEPHVVVTSRPPQAVEGPPLPADLRERLRRMIAGAVSMPAERVGDDVPLTRLGLDSVAALDLVRDLEALLGRKLPTTLLYENGTLDAILHALGTGAIRVEGEAASPDDGLLPAQQTFAVQRQYFPEVPGNVLLALTVDPALEPEPLRRALAWLADRHEALRSVIRREGDRWRQVPDAAQPEVTFVQTVDVDALHATPFDLERGPLLRVITDGRRLVLNAHHAVVDAWSLAVAARDLLEAHEAFREGRAPDLQPLPAGWAEARRALRAAEDPDTAWWAARYRDGMPPLPLPWDGPVDAPTGGPCRARRLVLGREATTALAERARRIGVTLPVLALAAWCRSLWRWSGQHDVVVRVAQGRREVRVPDVDRIVGSFADSLPLRVAVEPAEPFDAFARRVSTAMAEVQAHAASSAVALAGLGARSAGGPVGLTPAGFSFPPLPQTPRVGRLAIRDVHGAAANGFTRLGLIAWVFDGCLHATVNHPESHLRTATVERLATEHEASLRALARGEEAPARPQTLVGRILARCRLHPDRPAVEGLTYGDLDRRSGALASLLSGERIAVLAHPGPEAVVALLAVMRSGAAYVPLDPGWPDARVAQVVATARPTAVVVPPDQAARVAALDLPAVRTDAPAAGPAPEPPDDPERPAYVMFTSGSTGRPKGVVVTHRAVLAFQEWVAAVLGVREADRFVQTSSIAFGGSVRQVFTPLLAGATIHPVPPGLSRDPDALVAFLRRERITVFNSVPSLWVHLMDALERAGGDDPLPAVRWVLLGGEAVPAAPVRRWWRRYGARYRLANLYGSTETLVNATWHEVVREPPAGEVHTPIGWPRAGVAAHLVDVEDGVGEIAVSGHVASGYLDDPERTAAAFVDLPGIGRAYRTGDLARRRTDGALVYLGRRDGQVQVWGNRVELGEIEHTLVEHPGVDHAVLVQRDDGRLHATVAGTAEPAVLRSFLAERLPAWMVPHHVEVRDALPRTPAGKADRLAVRATLPADDRTALLARIWAEVLELSQPPGPDDDFFALGGDSILALMVIERLRELGEPPPSPLVLYGHPTLRAMAATLGPGPERPDAPPRLPDEGPHPLTPVQRSFWLAHHRDPAHPPTWTAEVPVEGLLDPAALREALRWLVGRHELLRAVFGEDATWRTVHVPPEVPLQYDDLSALPEARREAALETRWEEEAAARIEMVHWPLFRVRLAKLAPDRHHLFLAAHHLVADAWSAWLLAKELLRAHDALAAGRAPDLPPAPAFSAHLPPAGDPDPWWDAQWSDLPQRAAPPPERAAQAAFHLDAAAWERLRTEARRRSTSPFLLALAALFQALGDVEGPADRVVSTALAARDAVPGSEGVVGPYARALPVRVRGAPSVQAVGTAFREATAHARAPNALSAAGSSTLALARYFLSWMDPSAVPLPTTRLAVDWAGGRYRFATRSTDTEVFAGVLVQDGLHVDLRGGPLVERLAPAFRRRLLGLCAPDCALVIYPPGDLPVPLPHPLVVERVDAALATSDLVLLPVGAAALSTHPDLDAAVDRAIRATEARVVALAGMLPALTGLGTRPMGRPDQVVTTGHAATVVAMVRTVQRVLGATGREWSHLGVGMLGYGAIGRAVLELATHVLGPPASVRIRDPRLPESAPDLNGVDLVLGATSGGRALDVDALPPGTIVVDDSFPRCFDDAAALRRMRERADVLLLGGGLLDAGPLDRRSPFSQAPALRSRYGAAWLPGCHAEALLVAADPGLGPTVGPVDLPRALELWEAVARAGWDAAPLHLGAWEVPEAILERFRCG